MPLVQSLTVNCNKQRAEFLQELSAQCKPRFSLFALAGSSLLITTK